MRDRGRERGADRGRGLGANSRDRVKDREEAETWRLRHSKSGKFGHSWWSWRQRPVQTSEVAPRGWGWGGDHALTLNRTRTPTPPGGLLASRAPAAAVPASRRPCVLRAPPPGCRALGESPAPEGEPRPLRPRPAPCGRSKLGRRRGACEERAIAPGPQVCERACVRGWGWSVSPCPLDLAVPSSPPGRVPSPLSAPARCSWAAAGGRRGRGWPGTSPGRSPLPPRPRAGSGPAQAWYRVA